jgi:diaminopropionate ammonia-lyase
MDVLPNPFRGRGLPTGAGLAEGRVIADPSGVEALLRHCPVAAPTPLRGLPELAEALDVARLDVKDERGRMGLGSFKALGATHAIARMAVERAGPPGERGSADLATALEDVVFASASAGNHGLSVAAGARVFGAQAMIYLSESVPESFAHRLRERGATVVRAGHDYEASMATAATDASEHGWVLLSDSSWPGYVGLPTRVMEGYLIVGAEITETLERPATHVFLQAGVGGLAAALSALLRARWGEDPTLVVVEPAVAPALLESIRAGRPVRAEGPASTMGRLDCKEPSHLALGELARTADHFVTVTDEEAAATVELLARHGLATTPSGAAGVAGLHHAGDHRGTLALDRDSRVLAILTEEATP